MSCFETIYRSVPFQLPQLAQWIPVVSCVVPFCFCGSLLPAKVRLETGLLPAGGFYRVAYKGAATIGFISCWGKLAPVGRWFALFSGHPSRPLPRVIFVHPEYTGTDVPVLAPRSRRFHTKSGACFKSRGAPLRDNPGSAPLGPSIPLGPQGEMSVLRLRRFGN